MTEVYDNRAKSRYELAIDGQIAFAEYRRADGVIAFPHTLTPPPLRGQGVAGRIVRFALEQARADNLKVVPQCWFVADFIKANPEFQDLLNPRQDLLDPRAG
jgi:predicted GNAT family acetyltransferase